MMDSKLRKFLILAVVVGLASSCAGENDSASQGAGGGSGGSGITASVPTDIITGDGFYMLASPSVPIFVEVDDFGGRSYTQVESVLTATADDISDLPVSGRIIKFKTEWGTFPDSDTCVLVDGVCSVTWSSGAVWSIPPDCKVAITAWAIGEETFGDVNTNNLFDVGETLVLDYPEPVLDIDTDGFYTSVKSHEGVPEMIDMNIWNGDMSAGGGKDGVFTAADGLYTGSLCAANNTSNCTSNTSRVIFSSIDLTIVDFTGVAAVDKPGYCNNLYN